MTTAAAACRLLLLFLPQVLAPFISPAFLLVFLLRRTEKSRRTRRSKDKAGPSVGVGEYAFQCIQSSVLALVEVIEFYAVSVFFCQFGWI
jgi:hypothetical protein